MASKYVKVSKRDGVALVRFDRGGSLNAFNQDLGGPQGGTNSGETWAALGALSNPYTVSGVLVPEPGSFELVALGILGLTAFRRRHLS